MGRVSCLGRWAGDDVVIMGAWRGAYNRFTPDFRIGCAIDATFLVAASATKRSGQGAASASGRGFRSGWRGRVRGVGSTLAAARAHPPIGRMRPAGRRLRTSERRDVPCPLRFVTWRLVAPLADRDGIDIVPN